MPQTEYLVTLTEDELLRAADMLRYDGCYEINQLGVEWEVYLVSLTVGRWQSFGVNPKRVVQLSVTPKDFREHHDQATGFVRGIHLAQHFRKSEYGGLQVEGGY